MTKASCIFTIFVFFRALQAGVFSFTAIVFVFELGDLFACSVLRGRGLVFFFLGFRK